MSDPTAIRIRLEQDADFAFRISFPGTDLDALLTDEPEPLGHDRGPNPPRLLLAAIGNCMAASLLFALRKQGNQADALVAEVTATLMRNADGRWRIPTASVELQLPGLGSDYQRLERILAQFEDFCVVTQSVRQGIEVEVTVRDGEGRVLLGDRSFEAGA